MDHSKDKQFLSMVDQGFEELHQKIADHRSLVAQILEKGSSERALRQFKGPHALMRERRLKNALQEAIEVLEQTKKSFKSKTLEALRKRLIRVLTDAE